MSKLFVIGNVVRVISVSLFSIFVLSTFHIGNSHAEGCEPGRSLRVLKGEKPIVERLRTKAVTAGLPTEEDGYFDEEIFNYIGVISSGTGKVYHIATIDTVWGLSCRQTSRLVLFDKDEKYLGNYYGISTPPIKIEGNTLHIAAGTKEEVKVVFKGERPPKQIDGAKLSKD